MLKLACEIDGERRLFPLVGEEVRLGRGSENDIVLADFSVSRRHAVIRREPAGWQVYDLQSTNGIQLNDVTVGKGILHSGDRLQVGVFELAVEGESEPGVDTAGRAAAREGQSPRAKVSTGVSGATIIRPLSDFSAAWGLDDAAGAQAGKRQALEQAYSSTIFGFLTRLARLLITADAVDEVLSGVLDVAFDALPVDRGFILLKDPKSGELICELARFGARIEFRPESEVPVSHTMLEAVMADRVALLTYDALVDQRLAGGESIRIHQIRAAMCAPLWSGEKIIGVMQVDSPHQAGTFNEQDLDLLTALANYAAVAVERIRYAHTAELERQLRGRLERYHSPAVIEEVLRETEAAAGSVVRRLRQAEATVLFADLVGFTPYAEEAPLAEVGEFLEGYFTHCVEAIFAAGGTLDKFIGDCVMAFFGAPMPQDDHALRAVQAAIRIQEDQEGWNARRAARGLPAVATRIALNSGPVVVGDVGSDRRVDYTVLGTTVNVAARLEQSVTGPGDIVLGGETYRLLAGRVAAESLGEVQLKGLQKKVQAYRVLRR